MDSIKTLMDKGQYELVIKLTENSVDIDSLFFRISALLGVGKGEEALDCLIKNREILKKRLAFLMKVHIELLCILSKYDDAFQEVEYYRNLPYESQEVEEMLQKLPGIIRNEERKEYQSKTVSDDDLKKKLKSNTKDELIEAVELCMRNGISKYIADIQKLMVECPFQAIRSFALMMLVQEKLDKEVDFNSHNGLIKVNPAKLVPPFFEDPFNRLCKRMTNEFKNPTLSNNAIEILSSYIIDTYPSELDIEDDYVVACLYFFSSKILGNKEIDSVEEYCAMHNLDIEKYNKYYKIFSDISEKE